VSWRGAPCERRRALGLALIAALLAGPAHALPEGTYGLQLENDVVSEKDRHYTHGTRLHWVSRTAEQAPAWLRGPLEWLWFPSDFKTSRFGLALGQNIYTPEDKEAVAVVEDDRPYAGWLYVGASIHQEDLGGPGGVDTLTSFELDLGVVGPAALGEETQRVFHSLGSTRDPNGWDNQLDNEPAVVAFVERKWRTPAQRLGPLEFDTVPRIGGALGNVYTYAGAGLNVRLGQGLDVDYGVPLIRPGLNGDEAIKPDTDLAWYAFVGADGRYVVQNIFLDGNTFSSSHSVRKRPVVGDLATGAAVVWRDVRLTGAVVWRTKEFYKQRDTDVFGALTLAFGW